MIRTPFMFVVTLGGWCPKAQNTGAGRRRNWGHRVNLLSCRAPHLCAMLTMPLCSAALMPSLASNSLAERYSHDQSWMAVLGDQHPERTECRNLWTWFLTSSQSVYLFLHQFCVSDFTKSCAHDQRDIPKRVPRTFWTHTRHFLLEILLMIFSLDCSEFLAGGTARK